MGVSVGVYYLRRQHERHGQTVAGLTQELAHLRGAAPAERISSATRGSKRVAGNEAASTDEERAARRKRGARGMPKLRRISRGSSRRRTSFDEAHGTLLSASRLIDGEAQEAAAVDAVDAETAAVDAVDAEALGADAEALAADKDALAADEEPVAIHLEEQPADGEPAEHATGYRLPATGYRLPAGGEPAQPADGEPAEPAAANAELMAPQAKHEAHEGGAVSAQQAVEYAANQAAPVAAESALLEATSCDLMEMGELLPHAPAAAVVTAPAQLRAAMPAPQGAHHGASTMLNTALQGVATPAPESPGRLADEAFVFWGVPVEREGRRKWSRGAAGSGTSDEEIVD